jgi:iron complex transport system substrate-binding protein
MPSPSSLPQSTLLIAIAIALLVSCSGTDAEPADASSSHDARGFELVFDGAGLLMKSVETGDLLSLWFKSAADSCGAHVLCPHCEVHMLPDVPRIATWSTTHVPLLREAGGATHWVATGYHEKLDSIKYDTSQILDLGGAAGVDKERLLASRADVLTSYPFGNPMEGLTTATGVPVLPLEEYLEQHPLARAEYILLFGWLAGTPETARVAFDEIERNYFALSAQAKSLAAQHGRPTVFTGSEDAGVWHAPGGRTLAAQLIRDAGAVYLLDSVANTAGQRGNVQIDVEKMLLLSIRADFWGKVVYVRGQQGWHRVDAMAEVPWLKRDIGLFHCNTAEASYFTQAVVEPDLMLRDLLRIFHDHDSLEIRDSDTSFVYFQPTLTALPTQRKP